MRHTRLTWFGQPVRTASRSTILKAACTTTSTGGGKACAYLVARDGVTLPTVAELASISSLARAREVQVPRTHRGAGQFPCDACWQARSAADASMDRGETGCRKATRLLHWGECDPGGIIFSPNYPRWMIEGVTEMLLSTVFTSLHWNVNSSNRAIDSYAERLPQGSPGATLAKSANSWVLSCSVSSDAIFFSKVWIDPW